MRQGDQKQAAHWGRSASPENPRHSLRAFTLLEMVLVLFILALIAGLAIPVTTGLVAEERLRSQAKELQDYARTARKLAITENRPYQVVLGEKGFVLETYGAEKERFEKVTASAKLTGGVKYTLERWGESEFHKPGRDEVWVFREDGICEPVRVHFQNRDGWIEFAFNPLTARPQDETYSFP